MTEEAKNINCLYCKKTPIIGDGVRIISPIHSIFDCNEQITIGDNSFLGHGVKILTSYHDIDKIGKERQGSVIRKPVKIGSGVWVASWSIVLPGVTIGDNAVVGAGSVVTKNIPPNEFWAGNPCKFIRKIGKEK